MVSRLAEPGVVTTGWGLRYMCGTGWGRGLVPAVRVVL